MNKNTNVKYFFSNCFIEAIKAKLKDWNNVKITYISPKYNAKFYPHFLWSDGKNDYDFGTIEKLKWYNVLLFKGCIRKRNLGFNKSWKQYKVMNYKFSLITN